MPLGAGAVVGIGAGLALTARKRDDEIQRNVKVAGAQLGGGMLTLLALNYGIESGALAIGASAVAGPVLVAAGLGLLFMGAVNMMTVDPPVESTIHQGSVRG